VVFQRFATPPTEVTLERRPDEYRGAGEKTAAFAYGLARDQQRPSGDVASDAEW